MSDACCKGGSIILTLVTLVTGMSLLVLIPFSMVTANSDKSCSVITSLMGGQINDMNTAITKYTKGGRVAPYETVDGGSGYVHPPPLHKNEDKKISPQEEQKLFMEGVEKRKLERQKRNEGGPDQIVAVEATNKVETQSSFCGELDKFLTSLDLGKHSSSLSLQEFDLKTVQAMSKQELTDAGLPLGAAMKIVKFREGGDKA